MTSLSPLYTTVIIAALWSTPAFAEDCGQIVIRHHAYHAHRSHVVRRGAHPRRHVARPHGVIVPSAVMGNPISKRQCVNHSILPGMTPLQLGQRPVDFISGDGAPLTVATSGLLHVAPIIRDIGSSGFPGSHGGSFPGRGSLPGRDSPGGVPNPGGTDTPPTIPTIPASAPEPAAWALMVLGFGAIGVRMRKREGRVAC